MDMKQKSTPLVDEHLQVFTDMKETGTDDFFYTRLKARMLARQSAGETETGQEGWRFPLKPVWIVGTLALLLAVNGFMLSQQFKTATTKENTVSSPLQNFAASYDQTISSSY